MWIVCILCWVTAGVLLHHHKKIQRNDLIQEKRNFFDRLADSILSYSFAGRLYSEQVRIRLKLLYPAKEESSVCREYYREKLSLIIKILFLGIHLITLISYSSQMQSFLKNGNIITRNENGAETVVLCIDTEEENSKNSEVSYDVQSRMYSQEEIDTFIADFLDKYETLICGDNESLSEVRSNLVLKDMYEEYPMQFEWTSTNALIVDDEGTVSNLEISKPEIVTLTAKITYEEFIYEHLFSVCIYPKDQSEEEVWHGEILAAIKAADQKQKYTNELILPDKIGGKKVHYSVKEETSSLLYFGCLIIIAIVIFWAKDKDLNKAITQRKYRMSLKYPEFVSKFQLLLGAGITVRNIFWKMSEDVSLGEELGQELQLLVRDMKNGMSTGEALDRFGKRTANPLYIKFSALLIQNLKKGTKDLMPQLAGEAKEAFLLRKNQAKQLGEEAGTKLLGPMILLLAIVMAVLMIPAFLSFQF